jgi:hypothetical protein
MLEMGLVLSAWWAIRWIKNKRNKHLNGTELNSFSSKQSCTLCMSLKKIMSHHSYVVANCTTYLFHNSPNPSCRIWGFHSGGYEEFFLLGYNAEQSIESRLTFWRHLSLVSCLVHSSTLTPSSGQRIGQARNQQHVPLKCWSTFNGPHSFISQKIELLDFFIQTISWGPPSLSNEYLWHFPQWWSRQGVKLTTPVPRLRMNGAIHPLHRASQISRVSQFEDTGFVSSPLIGRTELRGSKLQSKHLKWNLNQ